jgi:hypothetical protein
MLSQKQPYVGSKVDAANVDDGETRQAPAHLRDRFVITSEQGSS